MTLTLSPEFYVLRSTSADDETERAAARTGDEVRAALGGGAGCAQARATETGAGEGMGGGMGMGMGAGGRVPARGGVGRERGCKEAGAGQLGRTV